MLRFASYLGVFAGLVGGIFVISLFDTAPTLPAPVAIALPDASAPSVAPVEASAVSASATSTQAAPTSQPIKVAPLKSGPSVIPAIPTPVARTEPASAPTPPAPPPPLSGNASLDASASVLRAALINIICQAPAGSSLRSMSGSGVFIDSKGVILTNAHVAQYFLLADRGVSCVIRSGSPAADRYEAALIYISPEWIRANPRVLSESLPNGTGEYDFALLAVTKSAPRNGSGQAAEDSLPGSFPFVPLATEPSLADTPVVIASYGAQFLLASQVQSALFPTVVFGSVKGVFTFAKNTIDVLALGGSAAAQEGSSGGGIINASGSLVGTITTSTVTGATETRSLNAITASYIRSQYASETGKALDLLLAEPTATSISNFVSKVSELESIITAHLP